MTLSELIQPVVEISKRAGDCILEVYNREQDIDVDYKADDSPLTEADLGAHKVIEAGLRALTPDIPVLSEESDEIPYSVRGQWTRYWLVDPLDGTKEFINRNDEFTVNIALIDNGVPVLGVVYVPVLKQLFTGVAGDGDGSGAYLTEGEGEPVAIRARPVPAKVSEETPLIVVGSRRHGADALKRCLTRMRQHIGPVEMTSMGSSLKICLVAAGKADIYPRLALTCEWDTAAAQAVVEASGAILVDTELKPLRYNQKEPMLNPFFYVIGDSSFAWSEILEPVKAPTS